MATKTTGSEWNLYYNDKEYWGENASHEDVELDVDGKIWESSIDNFQEQSIIVIKGGSVFLDEEYNTYMSLELHFKKWRKTKKTTTIIIEVKNEDLEKWKALVKNNGGKIIK